MRTAVDNALARLKEFFGRMSKKERIRFGILAAVVVILAIITVSILGRTEYETLHTASDMQEAGQVLAAVQEMGVPYRIEGTRILVPVGRAGEVRAILANEGVFSYGEPDMSILEGASGFGTTDDHRQFILQTHREQQIRASILRSEKIQNADVIVNFGQTSPFSRPRGGIDATASVILTIRGGLQLTPQEVQVIAEIVRTSITGIAYENINITDSNFNQYTIGDGSTDPVMEANSRIALQNYLSQQIQSQGIDLLTPIFGMDKVKVQANVVLNFDNVLEEHIEFAPPIPGNEEGMLRSWHELYEVQRSAGIAEGIPGTDENLNPPQYPYGPLGEDEEYRKLVNDRNYELNSTITVIERERGHISAISLSVILDSEAVEEDYSAEVSELFSTAFGVNPANITVQRMPFTDDEGLTYEEMLRELEAYERLQWQRKLVETIIMWAVILLLGLSFMALVRSIVKTIKGETVGEAALAGGGIDYLADDDYFDEEEYEEAAEEVELNTKSSGLEQIERFIDKDPAAVAQLLRNWLTDE